MWNMTTTTPRRLSRDEFAAAYGAARMSSGRYTLSEAVGGGFKAADQAMTLSAPDAIEALEELVKALDSFGGNTWHPDISTPTKQAKAVLARYGRTKHE